MFSRIFVLTMKILCQRFQYPIYFHYICIAFCVGARIACVNFKDSYAGYMC